MWITSTCSVLSGKFLADSNKWWFYVLFLKLQWPFIFLWIFISVIVGPWDLAKRPSSVRAFVFLPCLVNVCFLMLLHRLSSLTGWFFPPPDNLSPYLGFRLKKKKKQLSSSIDPVFLAWISTWCQRWKTSLIATSLPNLPDIKPVLLPSPFCPCCDWQRS